MNFATIFGGGAGVLASLAAYLLLPEPPFMTVHDMRVTGDSVIATRSINVSRVVADWRVTIVPRDEDAPSCQTHPGPNKNEGWSLYEADEAKEQIFTIDVWVGDEGCFARLPPGVYDMFVAWSPRSNAPTVIAYTTFEKEG